MGTGTMGTGTGVWRLVVESEQPIAILNLLSSPSGHLANLSTGAAEIQRVKFDFDTGARGFVADFADYPPADADIYMLTSGHRSLPAPLASESGLFISGVNRSDDLFMFFKASVGGLVPGARYAVTAGAEIATHVPAGCIGVGGAPGESVWIKIGASDEEPLPVLEDDWLRMNIDIGVQSNSGKNAQVLGNVANSRDCEQPRQWEHKSFPGPIHIGANHRLARWPSLAAHRRRLRLREPNPNLLHKSLGKLRPPVTHTTPRSRNLAPCRGRACPARNPMRFILRVDLN